MWIHSLKLGIIVSAPNIAVQKIDSMLSDVLLVLQILMKALLSDLPFYFYFNLVNLFLQ